MFGLLAAGAALVFVGLLRLPRGARTVGAASSPQAAPLFALAVSAYALAMTAGVVWAVPLALSALSGVPAGRLSDRTGDAAAVLPTGARPLPDPAA